MDQHSVPRRSACPVNATLEMVGDRWSLLIVRDLLFKERKSFKDFLEAEEGIATNILADRLGRLERAGIIEKLRDEADRRRNIYRLTGKGFDLVPVLIEMMVWAARHETTAAPADVIEAMMADRAGVIAELKRKWSLTQPRPVDR